MSPKQLQTKRHLPSLSRNKRGRALTQTHSISVVGRRGLPLHLQESFWRHQNMEIQTLLEWTGPKFRSILALFLTCSSFQELLKRACLISTPTHCSIPYEYFADNEGPGQFCQIQEPTDCRLQYLRYSPISDLSLSISQIFLGNKKKSPFQWLVNHSISPSHNSISFTSTFFIASDKHSQK